MNITHHLIKKLILFFGFGLLFSFTTNAQVKYQSKGNLSIIVSGTSTLHDWDMKSNTGSFEGVFTLNAAGAITTVSGVCFTTTAESLKSGKGSMDKNAYKALKSDKAAAITFLANNCTVTAIDANNFLVKSLGKLTLAGKTQEAEMNATCKVNADKSINIMASKKLSMKDYAMEPPSFMMGTIKTGNEVTLKFDFNIFK